MIESDGWKVQTYIPQPAEKKKKEGAEESRKKEAKTIKDIACDLLLLIV
ncbi:MAG: hypothetical protein ACLRTD_27375 [Bacteroides sp.]